MAAPETTRRKLPFLLLGCAAFLIAMTAGWTAISAQIDSYHSDWIMRIYQTPNPALDAMILEIDDATLLNYKGDRNLRNTLAHALDRVAAVQPKAVAIDLILAEESEDSQDQRLAATLAKVPNLVLSADIMSHGDDWEEPYKLFLPAAKAIGHVHADPDRYDGVSRQVQLEKVAKRTRHWALALETYRLSIGAGTIIESPKDLQVGDKVIPVARRGNEGRAMIIRYRNEPVRRLSVKDVIENPKAAEQFRNKVVFVGVTSQSKARDRLVTPTIPMMGVEINAHIYETIAQRDFVRKASNIAVVVVCVMFTASTALMFAFVGGWQAYLVAAMQIFLAHAFPHLLFGEGVIFPLLAPAGCAWLSGLSCAAYEYFVVRKQLRESEAGRLRYQQAIRFVVHEMKQPLTAIQGSSELMTRYNLNDDKRKQMNQMINSESKRLSRMMQTFLDVERLTEGQMQMKRVPFAVQDVVRTSVERIRPLADRKNISILNGEQTTDEMMGDQELMEYAIYNLLSNAIKYSPAETHVQVDARRKGDQLEISVRDQGIGLDEKELKIIGTKFYRTSRAEKSGEAGTGIGLSIVLQIVEHHGGRIVITSAPNHGSCFTVVVPVFKSAPTAEMRG